jgi:hypothetical protein
LFVCSNPAQSRTAVCRSCADRHRSDRRRREGQSRRLDEGPKHLPSPKLYSRPARQAS